MLSLLNVIFISFLNIIELLFFQDLLKVLNHLILFILMLGDQPLFLIFLMRDGLFVLLMIVLE